MIWKISKDAYTTGEKAFPPQHKEVLFLPKSNFFVQFSSFGDSEQ